MTHVRKIETENKWIQEVGMIGDQEYEKYNQVIQSVKEIKLKDFQYKTTNKILVTKYFLYRINKIDYVNIVNMSQKLSISYLLNVRKSKCFRITSRYG